MTNDEIIKALNALIQLDFDASKTYEQAIDHLDAKDLDVRVDLESFKKDHLRHIDQLGVIITELGGEPLEPNRDLKGILLEGVTKLRSITGTLGALKAMRLNERFTNFSYERGAELDLPPGARDVVLQNLEDERMHLAAIESHILRLRGEAPLDEEEDADLIIDEAPDLRPGQPL